MKSLFVLFLLLIALPQFGFNQAFNPDTNTSLLLHCNGNLLDDPSLENAAIAQNINYSNGIIADALQLSSNSLVTYNAQNNIAANEGTVELWVKPNWNGNDNTDHNILIWGIWGGLYIAKDGANNLKILVNRYGTGGNPERAAGFNISSWLANEWHHVAFTWSATELNVYIDGVLVANSPVGFTLPNISDAQFYLGSENGNNSFDGDFDEIRISDIVRSPADIAQSYLQGLAPTSIIFKENNIDMYPNWRYKPKVCAQINGQLFDVDPAFLNWSSSNTGVAYVNANGNVISENAGVANLTASDSNNNSATLIVNVQAPVSPPSYPKEDPFLIQPADCSKELMRVLVLNYIPTLDGINVDLSETGPDLGTGPLPVNALESNLMDYNIQMKFMSEERTKFRGYNDPNAEPYLGYEIVEYINIYEPVPRYHQTGWQGSTTQFINYIDMPMIADRWNWQDYVDNQDIDEVWVWAYHHDVPGGVFGSESEMSSPTTADISNSHIFNSETELPIYSKTYMVYWFNYGRTPNLHNHGHQLESIFTSINSTLFWDEFATYGRCGNDHQPPNTVQHYDYTNLTLVASDIMDWQPGGGTTTMVNADTWGNVNYNWPYGLVPPGIVEQNYYIFWMQSMPGYLNNIQGLNNDYLSNWWQFLADWDTYNYLTSDLVQSNPQSINTNMIGPCDNCDPILNITPSAFNGLYQADDIIYSNAKIDSQNQVNYKAGDCIELKEGFEVKQNSNFSAEINAEV